MRNSTRTRRWAGGWRRRCSRRWSWRGSAPTSTWPFRSTCGTSSSTRSRRSPSGRSSSASGPCVSFFSFRFRRRFFLDFLLLLRVLCRRKRWTFWRACWPRTCTTWTWATCRWTDWVSKRPRSVAPAASNRRRPSASSRRPTRKTRRYAPLVLRQPVVVDVNRCLLRRFVVVKPNLT